MFRTFSEFLAQKLIYSEFLDFVVIESRTRGNCKFNTIQSNKNIYKPSL